MQRHAIGKALNARRLAYSLPLFGVAALFAPIASAQAQAQEATSHGTTVTPSFSAQETITSNANLSATNPRWDAITQVSPGIRISSRSGRVQGSLSYTANALAHARDSKSNTVQNALSANGAAELIENHAFVDASASISQQAISAYGTQSSGIGLVNNNSSEVSTLSLSPSVRGNLGGVADVQGRVTWSATNSASTSAGDSTGMNASLSISGGRSRVGWALNGSRQVSDFKAGRKTTYDQLVATISLALDPSLKLSVRGGREANDVLTGARQLDNTYGWGVDWQPDVRTSLSLQNDHHYYGNSHNFTFQHRMARSIWSYSDVRGVAGNPANPGGAGRPVSLYDLLFAEFASLQPDPVLRDQLVRSYLQANGLDPNIPVGGGFLTSALTLQRSQHLSLALTGLRNTVTFSGFRTQTQQLDGSTPATGDLALGNTVRQLGYSVTLAHRLTPDSAVNLSAARLKTLSGTTLAGSGQRTVSLTWTGSLSRRVNGTLGARRTLFSSATAPYNESAVFGSVGVRF